MTTRDLKAKHVEALRRFRLTAQSERAQRKREIEDLKFADPIDPTDQWPAAALDSRAALAPQGSFPAVPARPALTINELRAPLLQLSNTQRQARLSVEFAPEGGGASVTDAEVFEDIARAIQHDSRAHLARNWAFDRAIRCGRGFYRLETEYVNDQSFDQKIVYKRILNQFSVYFYPYCQEADFSDAEWCFITQDVPMAEYKRLYSESDLAGMNDDELSALGDECNFGQDTNGSGGEQWIGTGEEGKTIRIAEYYYFDHRADTLVAVQTPTGPQAVLQSQLKDLPPGLQPIPGPDGQPLTRPVQVKQLYWCKLNALEFLTDPDQDEPIVERDGRYIPIVPVIADESNRQGERVYQGLVRPALDSQRLFNVEASTLAESVHLAPLAPYIGYAVQFEGLEAFWAQLNTRRFPYLPVNTPQSQLEAGLTLPQRNTAEQPIQAIMASLQQARSYIHDTTGIPPVALGMLDPHDRSGIAIQKLLGQSDQTSAGYVGSFADMSLLLDGKILRDLIPKIYDRAGRLVSAQNADDERRTLILKQPFVAQPGKPPMPVPAGVSDPNAQVIDLAKGQYSVATTVGKATPTKMKETADQLGSMATAEPSLVPIIADKWAEALGFPRSIVNRLEKAVPPQFKDDGGDQAALQQAQQQIQQLQQLLQSKTAEKQAEVQAKGQIDIAKTQMQEQAATERTEITAAASMANAQAKIDAENFRSYVDALETKLAKQLDFHMTRLTDAVAQTHEANLQHLQQAHEAGMAALTHQHALMQAQHAADIAPPPPNGNGEA